MSEHQSLFDELLASAVIHPGQSPLDYLLQASNLPEDVVLPAFAERAGWLYLYPPRLKQLSPAFDALPLQESLEKDVLALRDDDGHLYIVTADPYQPLLHDWISARLGGNEFEIATATRSSIQGYMAEWGESHRLSEDLTAHHGDISQLPSLTITVASLKEENQAVRGLNATLMDALHSRASDIHLENSRAGLHVRLRLDGVLVAVNTFSGRSLAQQIVSRIKVLSELDISEQRVPQDGRFRALINDRDVDIRVSIMPGLFGEDAVLRLLDRSHLTSGENELTLERLGFDLDARDTLRRIAHQPYGMLLITGPTGSGKTTTLYSLLGEVKTGQEKIITIEDPVEYQLEGVLQIPVNEAKGLTFSRGLRSVLRHDPDTIMVGEIRDPDTASISIQAALTGHTVFTSVHANSIIDVIQRFRHMGVDAYALTSALNGVVAQRLMRKICEHCAAAWVPDEAFLRSSGLGKETVAGNHFRLGHGCNKCRGTGYSGRMAIAEFMSLDDQLRDMIVSNTPLSELKAAVSDRGTRFLREVALDCAKLGKTTLQEVVRVTFAE
ncbi:GspE/PulE family protein [Halopseudomonas sabulinigri]|uniref:GspE/PulE family protein n=1 Tax=Halopseudomonas sabulinigri TaxID=472181 RepID=A0ABP9ZUR2_9GAMM